MPSSLWNIHAEIFPRSKKQNNASLSRWPLPECIENPKSSIHDRSLRSKWPKRSQLQDEAPMRFDSIINPPHA
jgi:hypothetical protein